MKKSVNIDIIGNALLPQTLTTLYTIKREKEDIVFLFFAANLCYDRFHSRMQSSIRINCG